MLTSKEIIHYRLMNQQIADSSLQTPEEMVHWLGAMQAQEYAMAKWAIGLRIPSLNNQAVEAAFNEGRILRTHLLRPTWHFVTPADIRWLLALTAPRIKSVSAYYYRQAELDNSIFKKTAKILEKALRSDNYLQRTQLQAELAKGKIKAEGIRLSYIMMHAELDGLICSGPRKGKQFTYALLDERAAPVKKVSGEDSLIMLMKRYFNSRGPATLQDFTVWSGLTIKDARGGMEALKKDFNISASDGKEYIFPSTSLPAGKFQHSFLMPDYDEYGMGYKDRSHIYTPTKVIPTFKENNPLSNHMFVLHGKIEGTWTKVEKNKNIQVITHPFAPLTKKATKELEGAVNRYQTFFSSKET